MPIKSRLTRRRFVVFMSLPSGHALSRATQKWLHPPVAINMRFMIILKVPETSDASIAGSTRNQGRNLHRPGPGHRHQATLMLGRELARRRSSLERSIANLPTERKWKATHDRCADHGAWVTRTRAKRVVPPTGSSMTTRSHVEPTPMSDTEVGEPVKSSQPPRSLENCGV